jgi:hypothetical protein
MTLQEFQRRCQPTADRLEDASVRYISSPQDHDLALATCYPFVHRAIVGWFPWKSPNKTAPEGRRRDAMTERERVHVQTIQCLRAAHSNRGAANREGDL